MSRNPFRRIFIIIYVGACFMGDPSNKIRYDELEPGYYHRILKDGHPVQKYWHRHKFKRIEDRLPENNFTILDIGCGPGSFLGTLEKRFSGATGIDIAGDQIRFAQNEFRHKNIRWLCADAALFEGNRKFDYITMLEVIEHLTPESTQMIFKNVKRLMKKDGRLLISTPNYRSLWPLIERMVNIIGPIDYSKMHVTRYTINKLASSLHNAGFRINYIDTLFVVSPFLSIISDRLSRELQKLEEKTPGNYGSLIILEAVAT